MKSHSSTAPAEKFKQTKIRKSSKMDYAASAAAPELGRTVNSSESPSLVSLGRCQYLHATRIY